MLLCIYSMHDVPSQNMNSLGEASPEFLMVAIKIHIMYLFMNKVDHKLSILETWSLPVHQWLLKYMDINNTARMLNTLDTEGGGDLIIF